VSGFLHLQTLLTTPANFRAFKVLIAAEYNGIELNIPEFDASSNQVRA
jgi:hypothetical protein